MKCSDGIFHNFSPSNLGERERERERERAYVSKSEERHGSRGCKKARRELDTLNGHLELVVKLKWLVSLYSV